MHKYGKKNSFKHWKIIKDFSMQIAIRISLNVLNQCLFILALIKISLIPLLSILLIKFGHISDSHKIRVEGFQKFKNLFITKFESIGKN